MHLRSLGSKRRKPVGLQGEVSSEEHLVTEQYFVRGKVELGGRDSLSKGPEVGRTWAIWA